MLSAVLLDVGGTLWPEPIAAADRDDGRLARLQLLLPSVDPHRALEVLKCHMQRASEPLEHDVAGAVRLALEELGLDPDCVATFAVVRAMCVPAVSLIQLFPGTRELLLTVRDLALRCVVLSNTTFRGAAEYWLDFQDFNVADLIDQVITSMDVGYRKPHPEMFAAAIAAAGCAPGACVMVGNSEMNDIRPAASLGMRTIRVAIDETRPEATVADLAATSLDEVASAIRRWCEAGEVVVSPAAT